MALPHSPLRMMPRDNLTFGHATGVLRVMAGDWVLLILDVIGAGLLAAALIIALWRRAAHQAQDEATRQN
jgi:hypothetical protein